MSHFNIDPAFAREYFKNTFDLMEKMEHDAMLHDAYFNGLFPSVEEAGKDLEVWSFIKGIHRKYAVDFIQPKRIPDVGTMGDADEPCLNELTRLIGGGIAKGELCVVVGKPSTATALRPEMLEVYKSRRENPVLHVALEDTKNFVVKRFEEIMCNAPQTSRRF